MLNCNMNQKTGVRYGVIHQNHVLQAWCDSSEPDYPECDCGDFCECEPYGFIYNSDGYKCSSDEYGDIFILESPYYTLSELCSPCAPNAGYIINSGDYKAYCFGHDWFEDGKAPYPVYSVETNELI